MKNGQFNVIILENAELSYIKWGKVEMIISIIMKMRIKL